ncbi:MAG: GPR endopeptidase [Bacilli bacterium]|nr:GPR endopeptidase [Bacilli bacterium]
MRHEIDLKNYQIRTDLAIEELENNNKLKGVKFDKYSVNNIVVTNVLLDSDNSLNRAEGKYITIEFQDITDSNNRQEVEHVLIKEIKKLINEISITAKEKCLIIGLGNDKSTPDSLGPQVVNNIVVTNHLYLINQLSDDFRPVAAINPGVTGQTGIETSDIISSIVKSFKPDFVIAIDSLASQSIDRVNKTIQMTDTGIHPGSGVGNRRKEISQKTIGVPVIAIGVPTVVDASVIVADTINYMYRHYAFNKEFNKNPKSKLTFNNVNYLKKEVNLSKETKKDLFGLIGTLNDDEIKKLIYEVLTPIGYNLMVTPKEVDFVIEKLALLVSNALNNSLHQSDILI